MTWGPVRSGLAAGVAFGVLVLAAGILFFLANQRIINVVFDFWTVCSLGLIFLGIMIVGGTMWARYMMRGGWRKWVEPWERRWDSDWEEPREKQP